MSAMSDSSRPGRSEWNGILRALVVSLAIHILVFNGYEVSRRLGWHLVLPVWVTRTLAAMDHLAPPKVKPAATPPELVFVEVTPDQAAAAPPKAPKYYSSKNSRASNPDPDIDVDAPKITGTQTVMPKTETTPRPQPMPLMPSSTQDQPEQKEARLRHSQPVGDLALARPATKPSEDNGEDEEKHPATHQKPRTVAEALARLNPSLAGEKMHQEGGVKNRGKVSLDAVGTPFGAYDDAVIRAIQARWYDLIDSQQLTRNTGRVVVQFRLHYDGSVTDMTVLDNTVGELLGALCQRAIIDPAPYAPWPSDMRRMVGANYRDVKFTFYYQ